MTHPRTHATAFAPATVGNIAVGFDILGHALDGPGDRVTVRRLDGDARVVLRDVTGVVTDLPDDPTQNTATAGLVHLIEEHDLDFGFEVSIHKGLALGSGMGGSAASAAASIVAAEALLAQPLGAMERFRFALMGEAVASGAAHGDNLAPCLFGGVQLVTSVDPPRVRAVPIPDGVTCALVHPHARLDTREARAALDRSFALHQFVDQASALAGFLAACWEDDLDALAAHLRDHLVEPLRAPLIGGFDDVKAAALEHGALGCSISGAGPSVFAWCATPEGARTVAGAMSDAFVRHDFEVDVVVSPVDAPGARLIEEST